MFRFRYVPTLKDYLAFNRHFGIGPLFRLRWLAVLLVAGYVGSPFLWPQTPRVSLWHSYADALPGLILPGILAAAYIASYITIRRRWHSTELMRLPRDYEIGDKGVTITLPGSSGTVEWQHFSAWSLVDGVYYLKTRDGLYRLFAAAQIEDEAALQGLLKDKIGASSASRPRGFLRLSRKAMLLWLLVIAVILVFYFYDPK